MSELKERLDNLRALMQDPSDEMMVRHFIEQIMTDQSMNCHLIEHNLYEVFLSICEDKRIAKTIPAMEEKKGLTRRSKAFPKKYLVKNYSSTTSNISFPTPHKGHTQSSGISSKAVPVAIPFVLFHKQLNFKLITKESTKTLFSPICGKTNISSFCLIAYNGKTILYIFA